MLAGIREKLDLTDDIVAGLEAAIRAFKHQFVTAAGHQLIKDEPVASLDKDEVDPTKITVVKK